MSRKPIVRVVDSLWSRDVCRKSLLTKRAIESDNEFSSQKRHERWHNELEDHLDIIVISSISDVGFILVLVFSSCVRNEFISSTNEYVGCSRRKDDDRGQDYRRQFSNNCPDSSRQVISVTASVAYILDIFIYSFLDYGIRVGHFFSEVSRHSDRQFLIQAFTFGKSEVVYFLNS